MDEKEVKVEEVSVEDATTVDTAPAEEPKPAAPESDAADCGMQLDSLIAEIKELNDKYLRCAAELENTRRRATLDAESAARTRAMSVAKNFLPVMDAMLAALGHAPDDAGIQSMTRAMESAFEQVGIKKIESVGQPLNPQLHNAIQIAPAGDVAPNTIVQEMQAGYMFGDNVLRTAMVVVAK